MKYMGLLLIKIIWDSFAIQKGSFAINSIDDDNNNNRAKQKIGICRLGEINEDYVRCWLDCWQKEDSIERS